MSAAGLGIDVDREERWVAGLLERPAVCKFGWVKKKREIVIERESDAKAEKKSDEKAKKRETQKERRMKTE